MLEFFQGEMSHVEQFFGKRFQTTVGGRPKWGRKREPTTCPWPLVILTKNYREVVLNLKRWVLRGRRQTTLCRACWVASRGPKSDPRVESRSHGPCWAPGAPAAPPPRLCARDHPHWSWLMLMPRPPSLKYSGQSPPNTEKMTGFIQVSRAWGCKVMMWEMQSRQMFSQAVVFWLEPHSPGSLIRLGGAGHH